MMQRPGSEARVVSRAGKIVILAFFVAEYRMRFKPRCRERGSVCYPDPSLFQGLGV